MSEARRPVTVLVIEDVQDTADTPAEFLREEYGFDVRVAADGETGLKWAQADPPDAVVCDIGLRRLDGLKVAEQVRDTVSPRPCSSPSPPTAGRTRPRPPRARSTTTWSSRPTRSPWPPSSSPSGADPACGSPPST